ncbi:MAG: NusG domain II-containing protein [Erysipelotrichaceae bacterium]|nr:NusG domain II-containing protein [Erysipelotrichaceae bacterium]
MKSNFSTKFNFFDLIVVIISVVVISLAIVGVNISTVKNKDSSYKVQIRHQNKIIKEISMDDVKDQMEIILLKDDYPNLKGEVHILIDCEKGICYQNVTCPNHTCEKMGWINIPNFPIVCVPNDLTTTIITSSKTPDNVLG